MTITNRGNSGKKFGEAMIYAGIIFATQEPVIGVATIVGGIVVRGLSADENKKKEERPQIAITDIKKRKL